MCYDLGVLEVCACSPLSRKVVRSGSHTMWVNPTRGCSFYCTRAADNGNPATSLRMRKIVPQVSLGPFHDPVTM